MQEIGQYLRKYRKYLIWGPFFKLLEALFELLLPILMAEMIQRGLFSSAPHLFSETDILRAGVFLLAFITLGFAFSFTCQWMASKCSQGLGTDLRMALLRKVQQLRPEDIRQIGQSRLRGVQSTDVQSVQLAIAFVIRLLIRAPVVCLGAILLSFYLQPTLAWSLFAVVPVFSAVLYFNMFRAVDLLSKIQERKDSLLQKITDIFWGMRVIRVYLGEEKEKKAFALINDAIKDWSNDYESRLQDINAWLIVLLYGAQLTILAFADRFLGTNLLSRADLLALLSYVNQVLIAMKVIANLAILFPQGYASAKRIEEVLRFVSVFEANEKQENDNPEAVFPKNLTIRLADKSSTIDQFWTNGLFAENLSYTYPKTRKPALSKLDFYLPQGKTLGILGGTGSGKSTLCRLLAGQIEAEEGHIFWQGKFMNAKALAEIVGFAPQEAVLFSGSLAENLLPVSRAVSVDEREKALITAQTGGFIDWKRDCQMNIQQFGSNFSGGQRQRLTVVRALLQAQEVLILDDVQSGLDFYTASKLRSALRKNYPNLTMVIASQRIEQVCRADWIVLLQDGVIFAQGTNDELRRLSSEYRQLYEIQFGGGEHEN